MKNDILHNDGKIKDVMRYLHITKRMKVKAVLPGHKYLIETLKGNVTEKEAKYVTTREINPTEKHFYQHLNSKHCKIFTEAPDSLIHYISTISKNTLKVDKEYVDDNIVSVKFKDLQERDKYTQKIYDYGGVFFMECKAPFRHHDYYAHSIVAGVDLKHLSGGDVMKYGKGNVVTVIDTGLDKSHCLFHDPDSDVPYFKWNRHYKHKASDHFSKYQHRKLVGYLSLNFIQGERNTDNTDATHGHGSHTAGTVSFTGLDKSCNIRNDYPFLPEHKILFVDIQNNTGDTDEGVLELPGSLEKLLDTIKDIGSDTISCSFGSPNSTHYSFESYMVDKWIYENEHVSIVVSAGNDGPGSPTVGSFGDAKNVITVGASSNSHDSYVEYAHMKVSNLSFDMSHILGHSDRYSRECMTDFSSRGTFDGRIKPDVVAPGSFILSADAKYNSLAYHTSKILYRGTSMSAPMVANFVSLVRHVLKTRDGLDKAPNSLVKSLLVTFARKMRGCQQITKVDKSKKTLYYDRNGKELSHKDYGHGLVDLRDFLHGMYGFKRSSLNTFSKPFNICLRSNLPHDDHNPFKVSMVYDDPPSIPGFRNGSILVNDLNLRMILMSPDWELKKVLGSNHLPLPLLDDKNNAESIETSLEIGDIVRLEVAPFGLISSYVNSGAQPFSISWNANMEEIKCPSECHGMGFGVQCVHNDEILSILCDGDVMGFGTYNETCRNDDMKQRMLLYVDYKLKQDDTPSLQVQERGYVMMGLAYFLAFMTLVFVILLVQ